MTTCLPISDNIVTISNNNYIINDISISNYGLYINDGSTNQVYELLNIPRNAPLRFYIDGCNNNTSDISHIIEVSHNSLDAPIQIYVSKGNDISFNNGDYFRFYDESFNLININNHNANSSTLTNSGDNFYFMNDVSYRFTATTDFSSDFVFSISGDGIHDNSLTLIDDSFIINIPNNADNSSNKIFYFDLCNQDISGDLFIARDNDSNKYYYDNIKFSIKPDISKNDISLSIISINNNLNPVAGDISNRNFFKYDNTCDYIIDGTNIIANELSNEFRECLNKISKADFSSNGNFYELNIYNHFTNNENDALNNNLSYVIYDGIYYIIDICKNYPIKVNNNSSNNLIIDNNYIYTKKINDYYYDAIKLIVNISNNTLNNDISLSLDISNIDSIINSNDKIDFIYSDKCSNPNSVNRIINRSKFNLINQNYVEFSDNYYTDSENYYSLNIYDIYTEPSSNGYIAIDDYNYDLRDLVKDNSPRDLSDILNITNNYTNSNFLITYTLTSYDEKSFELYRYVKINYGPFIEISGLPINYYKDNNSYTNIINISNNLLSPFDLSNIVVYLKNRNNDNRINLKFDIEFNNEIRYPINSLYKNSEPDTNLDLSNIIYNKNVRFPNNDTSGQNYYLSRNLLHFNYRNTNSNNLKHDGKASDNENPLVLTDISNISVSIDNSSNIILNDVNILSFFNEGRILKDDSKKYIDYSNTYLHYNFLTFYSNIKDNFEVTKIEENVKYKDLDNSFGLIELTQIVNDSSDSKVNTKLYLNDTDFIIDFSFVNRELSNNDITISGNFLQPKIFDITKIDVSYIGNYEIKIVPLGLDYSDNFYNSISYDISFINNIRDISKIYNINIIDISHPSIAFRNTSASTNTTSYEFDFPRDVSFNIIPSTNKFDTSNSLFFLNDACYNQFIDEKKEISLKPIIVFNDDSIYNIDLSYTIVDSSNINRHLENNELGVINKNQDASAVITYFGLDLCGNKSNDISLTILFKNIPQLTLSGEIIELLEVGDIYKEPGIFIDNSFYDFSSLTLTGPSNNSLSNVSLGSRNKKYDISFITDLCLNQVGVYDISYIVSFSDETTITFLKRFINVQDTSPPFIFFPDLSLINYDFSSSNSNNILATLDYLSSSDISYVKDKSNNPIIDFSLSLFSNISDLSKIIYDFSLVDNYTNYIDDVSVTSISLEIINISGGDISSINLIDNSLSNIEQFLIDNSYTNPNGSFIILTQSSDFDTDLSYSYYKPELSFNYIIKDICNNSFSFTRKVNIINYDISPNIFFTKNSSAINDLSNQNIVIYDISKINFSYQAYSYKKNPTDFIHEISNILFNFDISDQFSQIHNINLNNNVLISISNNNISNSDPSIISLNNLYNLYVDSFNTISYDHVYLNISNILEQFSELDNSFQLIYDFSNNQNLTNRQIRNVTIINTISCDISVSFQFSDTDPSAINISFGNTDFSFTNFFTLRHPRLTSEDVSFELSYNASPIQDFSSRIGDISFDVSALIYQYTDSSNIKSYNFSFYNTIINQKSTFDSSKIDISINIIIDPPFLKTDSSLSNITHRAGIYISDLSLIENVSFFSKFDEFYYYNNQVNDISISYSETNFTLSFEKLKTTTSEFNQSFPISDLSGDASYNIIYNVSDANSTSISFERILIIEDKTLPIINLDPQDTFDVEDFLQDQIFNIAGFNVQDSFSYLKTIDVSVTLNTGSSTDISTIVLSSYTIPISNDISYTEDITYTVTFDDISHLTNNFSDSTIITSYIATDIKNNSATDTSSITLNFSSLTNLNIAILYNDNSFNLNEDFYIPDDSNNWFLKYEHSPQRITYDASTSDISFSFSVDSSGNDTIDALLNNSIQVIPSIDTIDFTDICNISLYFQLFHIPNSGGKPIIKTRILKLNIIDKSPPNLSFINDNTEIFPNINNIILPEISGDLITQISSNINFLFDNEISYNYFIKNESNEIIYNIPSIKINDIVNDEILVANNINDFSNIIVPNNTNVTYDISISYNDLSNNPRDIDSSNLLTDPSKNFIQFFHVTENNSNPDFSRNIANDISRNISIQRFNPFINITYDTNNYKKTYHKLYSLYQDLAAQAFDYYDGSNIEIKTIQTINENNIGLQQVIYETTNTNNQKFNISRQVHIVDICCIFFDNINYYDISRITNDFDKHIRYGLYGIQTNDLTYNFYIDPSLNTYIALKSYKNSEIIDNSNIISINNYDELYHDSSNNVYYNTFDDCSYVKGEIVINVKNDFNRASLYWIHTTISGDNEVIDNSGNFEDLFLYHDSCNYYTVDNNLKNININDCIEFILDVSGNNNIDNNNNVPYFTISGNNGINNEFTFEATQRKTLHLHYGTYAFQQNKFTNFYNKIKFSYLPDGHHFNINDNSNSDISYIYKDFLVYNNLNDISNIRFNKNDISYTKYEYTNDVYSNSLAGINVNTSRDSYTYLEINANTPSPLYYYSENFSKMGGIIYTRNNISFSKNCLSLNGNILAINNNSGNVFNSYSSNIRNDFNEISNNLLFLSCRFELSANNPSETYNITLNKDFIALTQQNITHNIIINEDSNKIIFKKYDDISSINNGDLSENYLNNNYIIKKNNNENYLFDSSINFIERYKGTNLLLYNFSIDDNSANLLNTYTKNDRLELNALDFFFNNNKLQENYSNFFIKNKLTNNIYKKNNNNQTIYFINDHFKYNINEIAYNNQVKLINGNKDYIFFDDNDLLNSNRLIFEPIFDNLFTFNFQIYLDYNNLNLEPNYKNYLKNNIFNKNIYSNYDRNENHLFFDELFISIYSDISGPRIPTIKKKQSIIFSNNTIFINEQFLDSSNNKDTIDTTLILNNIDINTENLIILSAKDIYDNIVCGLTQQNFTHNINITNDYDNKVIFHKYNSDIFNYQVNDINLTREKTLLDSSNNNKYLLEFSSNDVYNCFIDICNNIAEPTNLPKKNKLMEPRSDILTSSRDYSFNTHITYSIYNEVSNNDLKNINLDVRSKDLYELNNLTYNNDISYAYANFDNSKNSHSFVINLLDYIDRNLFDNSLITIPANVINYNNINFIIKDISYSDQSKQFNLYDMSAQQIILYDKTKIKILNDLESKIHITNLKFEYLKHAYGIFYGESQNLTNFSNNVYNFINTLNLQNITTLYKTTGFITNTYAIELQNKSLNQLYSNVFYNSKLLINKYDDLINAFLYYDYYLLPPINNIYEDIRNFDLVDQLVNDISKIDINIKNINQEIVIRASQDIYTTLQTEISLNRFENYDTLLELTRFYLDYKERYEILDYELTLRHDIYTNIGIYIDNEDNLKDLDVYDSSFVELFNTYTINEYYKNLISNMINFNSMLLNDISSSVIYIAGDIYDSSSNTYIESYGDNQNNSHYYPPDISYLLMLEQDISINFNIILESAQRNYDFINKDSFFDNINYVLNGPSIFINAFKSTNILFKIELFYNSHLFPNKYLDTLVLDVTKPDLIPPTLIFNNDDISINQGADINIIIEKLIKDISYIELHEESSQHSISNPEDISYVYTALSDSDSDLLYNSNDLSLSDITIIIDISSIGINITNNLEVLYTVIDNANNQNTIKRNILLINTLDPPKLYYPNIDTEITNNIITEPLIINENDINNIRKFAKNNIILQDSSSNIYISKENVLFDEMLTIDISDEIITYKLSSITRPFLIPETITRDLSLNTISSIDSLVKGVCCFPPAFYHPIQHNYKLGANASYKMRLAKFIINNHR